MVYVVGEVKVDRVGADVWIFGRMYSNEALALDEYRAVCRGQRSKSEWTLKVLTRRGMVEVDGVSVEDVVAVGCRGVDVLAEFSDVEGGVVVVADGDGDGV